MFPYSDFKDRIITTDEISTRNNNPEISLEA